MTKLDFFKRLKAPRDVVNAGTVQCSFVPGKCHHCALVAAGISDTQYQIAGVEPGSATVNWSERKSKKAVVKLFDDSVEAMRRTIAV